MKTNKRRWITNFIMVLLFSICVLPVVPVQARDINFTNKMNELRVKFPDGKYWNHYVSKASENGDNLWKYNDISFANSVTSHPCATHSGTAAVGQYDCNFFDGIQCNGFAKKIYYDVYGVPYTKGALTSNWQEVQVGDLICLENGNHFAFVISRDGNYARIVESNYGNPPRCMIKWDRQINLSNCGFKDSRHKPGDVNLVFNSASASISVGTGDVTDITETNAVVRGVVNKSSNIKSGIRVGVRIGTAPNNFNIKSSYLEDVVSGAYNQNNGTNFPMWFNINSELGVTLKRGTIYYYQMMATYGGKTYYGQVKSFRTAGDGTAPTINKVESFNVKNDSFSVRCTASDNVGVTRINYYCWAEGDTWDKGGICKQTAATNGTSTTTITLKELNKTKGGNYYIDVLAYDAAGNVSASKGISVYVDRTIPILSDIKVYDVTETGYTVSCTATDNIGISRVQFPTWTEKDWQDDLLKDWSTNTKLKGTASGNTYTFRVNTGEHNNELGTYITHIYAYDSVGNYKVVEVPKVTVEASFVESEPDTEDQKDEKIEIFKKKKATISSLKNKKGRKAVITIKKVKYADGYEIKYSTSSKFKKNVKKVKTESRKKTLKNLKKGKTYYVKVRPYYKDSFGKIIYGKYGKVKKVKIKK